MTYMQALAVGWSIYWRQAATALCVLVVLLPLHFWLKEKGISPSRTATLLIYGAVQLAVYAVAYPAIIRALPDVGFSGFRLVVRRRDGEFASLHYGQAALLSLAVNAVPALAAPLLHGVLDWIPVLSALFGILVTMPLAGWILTSLPAGSLRFHVEDGI